MKVFINGATGLVGLSVVDAFVEAGHDVRASDRPGSDTRELEKREVDIILADLEDKDKLAECVKGMDTVVHVAGLFDLGAPLDLLDEVNHRGVRNMCEAALQNAPNLQRFLQVSTVGVYGKPVRCPCREEDPKRPRNDYERTKWLGEKAAFEYHHKHGLPVAAIRPTLIYGPRARYGHAMFIASLCLLKETGREFIYALKSGPRSSHVHIDDVGRAAFLVAQSDKASGKAFNVAAPQPVEGTDFFRFLAEPLGIEVKPVIPYVGTVVSAMGAVADLMPSWPLDALNRRLGRAWDRLVDEKGIKHELTLRLDKDWIGYTTADNFYDVSAIEELGMEWKWPDTGKGLASTIEWYRENLWIP